jgi:hypothetical protein
LWAVVLLLFASSAQGQYVQYTPPPVQFNPAQYQQQQYQSAAQARVMSEALDNQFRAGRRALVGVAVLLGVAAAVVVVMKVLGFVTKQHRPTDLHKLAARDPWIQAQLRKERAELPSEAG